MELSDRRRRSLARQATRDDSTSYGTKRRTRSVARMDVDNMQTTSNFPLDQQQQQQQQLQQQPRNMKTENATETEGTSAEADQSPICAIEQSHRDDDEGTVAATSSDSTAENIDKAQNDVSTVDDVTKPPTDGRSCEEETVSALSPEPSRSSEDATTEMFSDSLVIDTQVREDDMEDLQEMTMEFESERDQLSVTSKCVMDIEMMSSGTDELTAADDRTGMVNAETAVGQHHQMQSDDSTKTENSAEIETSAESGNSTSEEIDETQDDKVNDEEDDVRDDEQLATAAERINEEELEVETSPEPQHQPDAVADFTKPQFESTSSGEGDKSVEDLTNMGVPADGESDVTISTPVKTNPNSDDEQSSVQSPPLSNPSRQLPPAAALIFPVDGSPVPVIGVTCGDCRAEFHVDRLVDGLGPVSNSIGTSRTSLCVRTVDGEDGGVWMTPNQFQRASGRGTARDWKRSIKHHGVSLKSLLSKAVLSFDAASPGCRCNLCTVGVATTEMVFYHHHHHHLSSVFHVDCIISSGVGARYAIPRYGLDDGVIARQAGKNK